MNKNANIIEYMFFGGQSNMLGSSANANIQEGYSGNIANCNAWSDVYNGNQALNITGTTRFPATYHGWDIYFMRDLQLQLLANLYQFKLAYSGSGISQTAMQWYTDGLYMLDVEGQWEAIKKRHSDEDKSAVVKYMLWDNGEAEAVLGLTAQQEEDLLVILFNNFKRIFNNPYLKIFIRQLSNNQTFYSAPNLAAIKLGQSNFCTNNPGAFLVTSDDCAVQGDGAHFDEDGYRQLATNMLTVFNANILRP
jgi:hypothetical protein